jgi:hypothetical protein
MLVAMNAMMEIASGAKHPPGTEGYPLVPGGLPRRLRLLATFAIISPAASRIDAFKSGHPNVPVITGCRIKSGMAKT